MIDFEKFDIKEEDQKIVVTVVLRERNKNTRKQICTTKDIIFELKSRGIVVGDCVFDSFVSNRNANRISGRWVFDLPVKEEKVIPPKGKPKASIKRGVKK